MGDNRARLAGGQMASEDHECPPSDMMFVVSRAGVNHSISGQTHLVKSQPGRVGLGKAG